MNPGLRDDNGRRESAFAGERRASPDSGRKIEIPSAGVTDREISGLLGLDHSVPDPVDRGELSIGTHEGDRISTLTMSPGVVMTSSTTNGASGLIVTGSEAKSTDPVGSGNIASAASTESGFHVQSAPKDGCSGMLKTGSEQRGPDPIGGMGTGGKDIRGVGAHVHDQLRGHIPDKALLEMPDLSFTHRKRPTTLTEIQAPPNSDPVPRVPHRLEKVLVWLYLRFRSGKKPKTLRPNPWLGKFVYLARSSSHYLMAKDKLRY